MQRQTRSMERSNSMRGKRSLETSGGGGAGGGDDDQPERKRPALASVIVEALKVDSLQRLCSSLEPILRRVVSEEVERALARIAPAKISGRASPKRIGGSDGRNLQLHFRSKLSLPLFTGGKVEGEQGAAIHVVLIDANTGHVVTSGPESSTKLEVVVLEGDFNNEDDEDWSQEEFESHVVKERDGKRPLLHGELHVNLKEGVGTLGELTFTDNSSWIRSRKFRLGLKVSTGHCEGMRIREAKTEAFTVKDHRGELYKKHYPPALNDEVWRLEKIGKDGSFHKRLNSAGIYFVEDFLRLAVRDPQKLRTTLGSGMSNRMWDALMEHAKTCVLSGKLYVYYSDDARNVGVAFNNIYELSGLIAGDQFCSADTLSDSQKVYVDALVKKAYDNWHQVIEYDGKALLNSKQTRRTRSSQNELSMNTISYSNPVDSQLALPRLPVAISSEQAMLENNVVAPGYNDNMVNRFPNQSQLINSNSHNQFENNSFSQHGLIGGISEQTHITGNDSRAGLALGPSQPSASEFQVVQPSQPSNINPYDDWSQNQISEDDIRNRSHELLESDDMQQLLRLFSLGGHVNMPDEAFSSYPSFMPTPSTYNSFEEDRSRSGKAVVGWLKIKAAMRWGFFIRKKAAERRAQLVELDD
ncbi:calmodulin-binding protein 60 D-like isoform X2 [Chenopodium quinoa]|uniref:calmodulin-binding protein 60 D-like isoform X2 n=1 Tax=Chenopodium quinoa TaxID=63459 RepID=UPI000B77D310|nr:calmodulin-binding protein 60 D-like isoform X2 [Chenopodium quinoa]